MRLRWLERSNQLHAYMNASRRLSIKIPASSTPSNLNIVATEFNLKLKVNEAQSENQAHLDFKQSQHTFFHQMFIARTGFLYLNLNKFYSQPQPIRSIDIEVNLN